jgi:hypothetical protein
MPLHTGNGGASDISRTTTSGTVICYGTPEDWFHEESTP